MGKRSSTGFYEILQHHAEDYLIETGKDALTTMELAVWAIKNGRWEPPADMILKKCREDYAKALREEYVTDESGQPVRVKHVARVLRGDKQLYLWGDIRRSPRDHLETAFQQRRDQIAGDCKQLYRDIRYFNKIRADEKPIQKCFDFTDDVEEGNYSGEYPAKRPQMATA